MSQNQFKQKRFSPSVGESASRAPYRTAVTRQKALLGVCFFAVAVASVKIIWERSSSGAKSVQMLEQEAQQHPGSFQAQLEWANALQKSGDVQRAMQAFSMAAHLAPNDARPYIGLGTLALQDGHADIALVNFREATQCSPNDADLWRSLAALYLRKRAYMRAIDAYQHLTHLQPEDQVGWRRLGILQTHNGMIPQGHEALRQATLLKPDDPEAQTALGVNALALSQLPEAKQAFERALTQRANDEVALTGLATTTLQLDPSPAGLAVAGQQVNRSLTLRPTGEAYATLGRIYLLQREYKKAIQEFRMALRLDIRQNNVYVYLSQAYAGSGKPDLARQASAAYQKALASTKGSVPESVPFPDSGKAQH